MDETEQRQQGRDRRDPTDVAERLGDPSEGAPKEGEAVSDFFNLGEVFRRVLATADEELERGNGLLFWSGLAGGLVLGMCLVARAALSAEAGSELVGQLLYPVGFIILILGRYQLFTENTLTPVTLVMVRLASFRDLARIWGVVFAANIVGAGLFAAALGPLHVLSPEATELAIGYGEHLVSESFVAAFGKAVMAGWVLALLVWLIHAARETMARIVLVWLLIYLQVSADMFHCIVGSLEVLFAVFRGAVGVGAYLTDFLLPVTLGNTVGGVVFVAVLNYVQLGEGQDHFTERGERLTLREWVVGRVRS